MIVYDDCGLLIDGVVLLIGIVTQGRHGYVGSNVVKCGDPATSGLRK